jgi:GTP-binding protein YchF
MKLGIVGLPNVGKSTLFNSLTKAGAESANYPFCTIDPNVGVVPVPDERLEVLTRLTNSPKTVYANIEFVDIAGLVKGASKGEGLGNQFLSNIREVDAIVHVVRCFEDANIVHVDGSVDPLRDIETINYELLFSDMEILERRKAKLIKSVKGDKSLQGELDLTEKLLAHMEKGNLAKVYEAESDEEEEMLKSFNLLTYKPTIYGANVTEDDLVNDGADNEYVQKVREYAKEEGSQAFVICAKIEEEIAELDEDEKKEFLDDLGIKSSGLDKLIAASYDLLGLISYITTGDKETKAWTIKKGTKAPQAAGKIHSDFERGFIRAEIVSYDNLVKYGSIAAARDNGVLRSEGKEYVVQDGDVVEFRFNV